VALGADGSKVSGLAALHWVPRKSDKVYLMAYGINDGDYAYHNWQTYYLIWNHELTRRLFSRLQLADFYERNVPVSDTSGQGYIPTASASPGSKFGYARGESVIEILEYSLDPADYVCLYRHFRNSI
jgi:hypothetical protein